MSALFVYDWLKNYIAAIISSEPSLATTLDINFTVYRLSECKKPIIKKSLITKIS